MFSQKKIARKGLTFSMLHRLGKCRDILAFRIFVNEQMLTSCFRNLCNADAFLMRGIFNVPERRILYEWETSISIVGVDMQSKLQSNQTITETKTNSWYNPYHGESPD